MCLSAPFFCAKQSVVVSTTLSIEKQDDFFYKRQLETEKKIICYLASWSVRNSGFNLERDIEPNLCTHIIYAFANFDVTGMMVNITKVCLCNFFRFVLSSSGVAERGSKEYGPKNC